MTGWKLRRGVPQCTLADFEERFADRHLLHAVVRRWAARAARAVAALWTAGGQDR